LAIFHALQEIGGQPPAQVRRAQHDNLRVGKLPPEAIANDGFHGGGVVLGVRQRWFLSAGRHCRGGRQHSHAWANSRRVGTGEAVSFIRNSGRATAGVYQIAPPKCQKKKPALPCERTGSV